MASNGALRTCEAPAACCWMSVWKVAHVLILQGKNSQSRLCFKVPRSWWAGGCALCDRRIKMTVHDTRHFRFWDFYGQKKVGLKELACLTRSCPMRRWICFLDRCQKWLGTTWCQKVWGRSYPSMTTTTCPGGKANPVCQVPLKGECCTVGHSWTQLDRGISVAFVTK